MTTPAHPAPVVIVGFMGAGKTTVGRMVAQRLGVGFADSDDVITERTGRTPREIFATDGEAAFRSLEREAVRDLVTRGPATCRGRGDNGGGGDQGGAGAGDGGAGAGDGRGAGAAAGRADGGEPVGVVALGGGAVEDAGTRELLHRARVVHLEVSFEQVGVRIGDDPGRPVLARPDLPELFAARQAAYRAVADVVVPTDGLPPAAVADRVVEALTRAGGSGSPRESTS